MSEIPNSLKNPYALTISLNGTSQGPYDGSAAKNINITPSSIGAATSGHNHDGRYVRYYAVTTLDCNNLAVGLTSAGVSATNAAHPNQSAYLYISDVGTPFQLQIPDASVPYIYKRYYSSGTWSRWFKLYAGYADSAGNADTVDGYHASSLWRSDGGIWNPGADISLTASGNNQEWSFNIRRNDYTGCYWQVWDNTLHTLLKVNADNGKVYAPYNFVGNLEGNTTTSTKSEYSRSLLGRSSSGSDYSAVAGNLVFAEWNTMNDNRWYLKATDCDCRVAFANNASRVYGQVKDTGSHELVRCNMNNDRFRIIAGSNGSNNGWAEIATAGDGNEPIYVRQYTGVFSSVVRTLTLLDANGYTHFPSYINIGGNENNNSSPDRIWGSNGSDSYLRSYRTSALRVASATKLQTPRTIWGQSFDGTGNISGSLSGVGHIQFSANNSYSIGTTTSEAAHTYTRQVWARYLNASRVYTGDTNLYIGYSNTAQVKFFSGTKQSGDGSNERMTILNNGNVGIGTTSPVYNLDVSGDIWCRGALRVGSSATNNYIAFYGNSGDAPGLFVTSFIGEHLWGGDESTELLLMKFNDVGNGVSGTTVYGSGPDRIRHIAHAHVF